MRFISILLLLSAAAFGQAYTRYTVLPLQNNSATGGIDFRELYSNGQNYVRIKAPTSLTANRTITLPGAASTVGYCLTASDTVGTLAYQSCLATNGIKNIPDYDWSQTIGALTAGTRTISFAPCPGNASDILYKFLIYETATPTTSEVVYSTGVGTCTTGAASGTIQAVVIGTYTNAGVSSTSSGALEAIFSVAAGGIVTLYAPNDSYYVDSDIAPGTRTVGVVCSGPNAVFIPRKNNVKVFNISNTASAEITNCGFDNSTYAKTGTTAIYFNNLTGSTFGGRFLFNSITAFENGIHGVTWYLDDVIGNRITNATNAAIWSENIDTGDAGAGEIAFNNISCSVTCTYGLLWNGPGALQFKDNGINGATEQVHLEPLMGYATAADSGADTVISWVSGNKFRTNWVIPSTIQIGTAGYCTVSVVTSDTSLTCAGINLGSLVNQRYYVNTSGQIQVIGNLLDGGTTTTHGVRLVGEISFFTGQIEHNFVSSYVASGFKGISIESSGIRFLAVKNNNVQASFATSAIGINVTAGAEMHFSNNQLINVATGMVYGASALYFTSEGNRCATSTTVCLTSAASTGKILETGPFTYAQVAAMTLQNGSRLFCSDCNTTAITSACATGGTGAVVDVINAIKLCYKGAAGAVYSIAAGPTGALVITPTTGSVIADIDTAYICNKAGVCAITGPWTFISIGTATNCADAAGDAACGSAAAGSVVVDAADTTTVVSTTAVTANSEIILQFDASLGTRLGVTCNTTYIAPQVTARTASTSFTITLASGPVTNPQCISYAIRN